MFGKTVEKEKERCKKRKLNHDEESFSKISGDFGSETAKSKTGEPVLKTEREYIVPELSISYECSLGKEDRERINSLDIRFCHNNSMLEIYKKQLLDKGTCYVLCYYWLNQQEFFLSVMKLCKFMRNEPYIIDVSFNPTQSGTWDPTKHDETNEASDRRGLIYPGLMILIRKVFQ